MTIDERLERLTERHEALAQTMELIAAAQMENDRQIAELRESVKELREYVEALAAINRISDPEGGK